MGKPQHALLLRSFGEAPRSLVEIDHLRRRNQKTRVPFPLVAGSEIGGKAMQLLWLLVK